MIWLKWYDQIKPLPWETPSKKLYLIVTLSYRNANTGLPLHFHNRYKTNIMTIWYSSIHKSVRSQLWTDKKKVPGSLGNCDPLGPSVLSFCLLDGVTLSELGSLENSQSLLYRLDTKIVLASIYITRAITWRWRRRKNRSKTQHQFSSRLIRVSNS